MRLWWAKIPTEDFTDITLAFTQKWIPGSVAGTRQSLLSSYFALHLVYMHAILTGSAEPMLAMFPPLPLIWSSWKEGGVSPSPGWVSPSPAGASPPLTENTVGKCPLTHWTILLNLNSNFLSVDQQTDHFEFVAKVERIVISRWQYLWFVADQSSHKNPPYLTAGKVWKLRAMNRVPRPPNLFSLHSLPSPKDCNWFCQNWVKQ